MADRPGKVHLRWLVLGLGGLALAVLWGSPAPLLGERHGDTISGRVINGTPGAATSPGLEVVLHGFGEGGEVATAATATDKEGRFQFTGVESNDNATHVVSATYGGVSYTATLDRGGLAAPLELIVYETTSRLDAIEIEADVLLLRDVDRDRRGLLAFEAVSLVNLGVRTFVPDLDSPGSMNFLRFSHPEGATDLEVSSDLPGGRIISVGVGFALTAPVSPGPHRVTYSYRLPYGGSQAKFDHSLPMGSKAFRLLVKEGLGEVRVPGNLSVQPSASAESTTYSVWGSGPLSEGTRLLLEIDGLPQPSLLRRMGDSLADGEYLTIGIPAAVGLVLAGLLLYALILARAGVGHRTGPEAAVVSAGAPYPASLGPGATGELEGTPGSERWVLLESIARLDEIFQRGQVTQEDYEGRREELKSRLLRLAMATDGQ